MWQGAGPEPTPGPERALSKADSDMTESHSQDGLKGTLDTQDGDEILAKGVRKEVVGKRDEAWQALNSDGKELVEAFDEKGPVRIPVGSRALGRQKTASRPSLMRALSARLSDSLVEILAMDAVATENDPDAAQIRRRARNASTFRAVAGAAGKAKILRAIVQIARAEETLSQLRDEEEREGYRGRRGGAVSDLLRSASLGRAGGLVRRGSAMAQLAASMAPRLTKGKRGRKLQPLKRRGFEGGPRRHDLSSAIADTAVDDGIHASLTRIQHTNQVRAREKRHGDLHRLDRAQSSAKAAFARRHVAEMHEREAACVTIQKNVRAFLAKLLRERLLEERAEMHRRFRAEQEELGRRRALEEAQRGRELAQQAQRRTAASKMRERQQAALARHVAKQQGRGPGRFASSAQLDPRGHDGPGGAAAAPPPTPPNPVRSALGFGAAARPPSPEQEVQLSNPLLRAHASYRAPAPPGPRRASSGPLAVGTPLTLALQASGLGSPPAHGRAQGRPPAPAPAPPADPPGLPAAGADTRQIARRPSQVSLGSGGGGLGLGVAPAPPPPWHRRGVSETGHHLAPVPRRGGGQGPGAAGSGARAGPPSRGAGAGPGPGGIGFGQLGRGPLRPAKGARGPAGPNPLPPPPSPGPSAQRWSARLLGEAGRA